MTSARIMAVEIADSGFYLEVWLQFGELHYLVDTPCGLRRYPQSLEEACRIALGDFALDYHETLVALHATLGEVLRLRSNRKESAA